MPMIVMANIYITEHTVMEIFSQRRLVMVFAQYAFTLFEAV